MTETADAPPGSAPPETSCSTLRGEHERAVAEFAFPDVGEQWNWAIDWFDAFARGNDRPGLVVVEEDGSDPSLHLRRAGPPLRPGRGVAARPRGAQGRRGRRHARQPGRAVGDDARGHQARRGDHADHDGGRPGRPRRPDQRGNARYVVCNPADAAKFDDVPGDYTRIGVGRVEAAAEWHDLHAAYDLGTVTVEHPGTAPDDRLLLYFTSGTTSRPKLVEHTQVSYPLGHLSTMYWLGLQPGDVHLNISSPGWAKHAWSCFFAPWNAEATVLVYNYARFDAAALLAPAARARGHQLLRAADGVADAHQRRPLRRAGLAARGDRRRRAAQPRGDRAGTPALGAHHARRLRADRDHGPDRQHAGLAAQARLDGPAAAGRPGRAGRPGHRSSGSTAWARARSASSSTAPAGGRCR